MSEITKFLMDDHARIRRAFNAYKKETWKVDAALNVCDQLRMHSTIEEELLYPVVRDHVDAGEADEGEKQHAQISKLMDRIERLTAEDPAMARAMSALESTFTAHVLHEERVIFPRLYAACSDLLPDLGGEAFRRRQELFDEQPPRTWDTPRHLANTGWGGGGRNIPNSGW